MIGTPKDKYKTCLVCLILFLGTLALYWPAHRFDFVQYDDDLYVFNNKEVTDGLTWWGLAWSFVDAHAFNWHPLTWLSHMLDCQLFGLNAGPHHLVNVLFHCANAALLFIMLRSMTGTFWRSAFVAAVFTVHPLRVESVAWIAERKDVLSGFFFLLTLWCYAEYAKRDARLQGGSNAPGSSSPPLRSNSYRLSLAFFALGLLAKPMLVTLPFLLLLLDFWPLDRLGPSSGSTEPARIPKKLWVEKIPYLLMAMALSVITFLAQKSGGAIESVPLVLRIENMFLGYVGYLEKLFYPRNLTFLYFRLQNIPPTQLIAALVLLAGISVAVVLSRRPKPYLAVGWFWFLGMLLPVSGIVPVGLQFMADRYSYLSSIGILIIIAWGATEAASAWLAPKPKIVILGATSIVILSACFVASRQQLLYWRNTETLMGYALTLNPNNYVAHSNLGVYLSKQGRTEEALLHYERARQLSPKKNGQTLRKEQPSARPQVETNSSSGGHAE